jgi:hypothetical protein
MHERAQDFAERMRADGITRSSPHLLVRPGTHSTRVGTTLITFEL